MSSKSVTDRFQKARRSTRFCTLEGFHPIKHALRFGGRIVEIAAAEPGRLAELCATLAPDVADALGAVPCHALPVAAVRALATTPRGEAIVAIALRPTAAGTATLHSGAAAPVIFLEAPSQLTNIGAVVRVAAAGGAAAVLTTGMHDPWHPAALRGSAGLHFALPVERLDALPATDRHLVALHPDGDARPLDGWPDRAVLAFGTERHGLSPQLLERADSRIAIPMRPGVSSLSLATAVAATLYARAADRPSYSATA